MICVGDSVDVVPSFVGLLVGDEVIRCWEPPPPLLGLDAEPEDDGPLPPLGLPLPPLGFLYGTFTGARLDTTTAVGVGVAYPRDGTKSRSDGVGFKFKGGCSFVRHSSDQIAVSVQ